MNAVEIESAVSDLALQPFDGTEFPFAFLQAFGNKETTIKRLRSGKIYAPERIGSALSHFFSRSNLAALREIALRRAADRLTRASAATVPHAAGGEDVLVLVTADAAALCLKSLHDVTVKTYLESLKKLFLTAK